MCKNDRNSGALTEKRLVLSGSEPFGDRILIMSDITLDVFAFSVFLFDNRSKFPRNSWYSSSDTKMKKIENLHQDISYLVES